MEKRLSNQKITSNLWFNKEAEEAVNYYLSIFKDGKIGRKTYYTAEGFEFHGMAEGTVLTMEFILEGQEFVALNGGPHFKFNEAISFIVNCKDQKEVDYYWEKLGEGGDEKAQMCGWLKDKFGVSWQIVPTVLTDMMQDPDATKVAKVTKAVFQMKKLDIAELEKAFGK
ncbi:VOC family protein [Chitinophaga sp. SYP-B3965]|uniref:VOC family protein n=1 Tax=Chitinophaga sp. SYP-B3965 TaxID=2663120 RepID=UPI00129961F9|nr:VOC family protein [Chitinophaga sp. SYP-B3965]MRG47167.1 VOC family protein [Chitinophaga sp. SYP-B3965]